MVRKSEQARDRITARNVITQLAQATYDKGLRIHVINGDGEEMTLTFDAVFEVWPKEQRPCIND